MDDLPEYHHCPECGNACPSRPPLHGPTTREVISALDGVLAGNHDRDCPMVGYPGGYQGYIAHRASAHCRCSMRSVYALHHRLMYPKEEED